MHSFHIPVLGISFSVDSPVKVAKFGMSSVVSIIEDGLLEKLRKFYAQQYDFPFEAIDEQVSDYRAKRITAYLNLLQDIVDKQLNQMKTLELGEENSLTQYLMMLPETDILSQQFQQWQQMEIGEEKDALAKAIKQQLSAGAIDVNIMAKVDNLAYDENGQPKPVEYSDALSALRGFAQSNLSSSLVLSAGYNPRLYNYIDQFTDFFPDEKGNLKKKIILKVSDFRSAQIQGKLLAKKGVWVNEFRIESGLNCGGHAFATDGYLMGTILEEFKQKRKDLANELFVICQESLHQKSKTVFQQQPHQRITVQGGIGTALEDSFLRTYYQVDGTGWGSPFLLVPEATSVDNQTLDELSKAKKEDLYLSGASPLGVPFHYFKKTTSEQQRLTRIEKGRPGSPCYKKYLSSNTQFSEQPICTASRQYQHLKSKELATLDLSEKDFQAEVDKVMEKDCLCEGLSVSALLRNEIEPDHKLTAVTICPGPNIAYFSGVFTLKQMVDHIYGRTNLLNKEYRPHMFINELQLYVNYFKKMVQNMARPVSAKQEKTLAQFKNNLFEGIDYYKSLIDLMGEQAQTFFGDMTTLLQEKIASLEAINWQEYELVNS